MQPNILKEKVRCYLCGSDQTILIASGTDREYYTTPEVFLVVECCCCKLRYLNPRPAISELSTIYPLSYYSYHMDVDKEALGFAARMRHRAHGHRFRDMLSFVDSRDSIDVLDVGCGDGWMLYLFKLADPHRIKTFGIDINPAVCQAARSRGHTVFCGLFEDSQFNQQFDVINLSNVIEHVTNPAAVVEKSFSVLKKGGILILETPNCDSWDARLFKEGLWGSYHIPRHFTFFNPSTISKLGSDAGFKLSKISFTPAPTQWVWTMHNIFLSRKGRLANAVAKLFEPADCFTGGMKPFFLLGMFTVFDWVCLKITGQSSNMTAVFKKI